MRQHEFISHGPSSGSCERVDDCATHALDRGRRGRVLESEDVLHDRDLCGGCVEPNKCDPVVHDHACAEHLRASVDCARRERHLEQRRKLIKLLHGDLGVHDPAPVRERAERPYQRVAGNRLTEHLDAERVRHDLFCLAVKLGVNERHIVVRDDAITKRREALLDTLHDNAVGQRVAEVQHLLIGRAGRHKQPLLVAGSHPANNSHAGDRAVHDRDHIMQLGLERRVEVLRATDRHERVAVCELGEDADIRRRLEFSTNRHGGQSEEEGEVSKVLACRARE
eukprot:Amastigsp_a339195_2870.p2 type:complete len:281 gc:universal Amastigsp_a339195_2870:46-888(+)